MNEIAPDERAALESMIYAMERAWNAGDAAGFAASFAAEGDQVNIFGMHLRDRDDIIARHAIMFKSVFRESRNVLRLLDARHVTPDVILARVSSSVDVPEGPLRGELRTIASLVLRRNGPTWELVTFHNTRIATAPQ